MLVDEWWVFRNNDHINHFFNHSPSFAFSEYLKEIDASISIFSDGYFIKNDSNNYILRVYIELYSKENLREFQYVPENIVVKIENKKMTFDKIRNLRLNKNEIYGDFVFQLKSYKDTNPSYKLNEKEYSYLISFDLSKFIIADSEYVEIENVLGFQKTPVKENANPDYSPYD